MDNLEKEIDKSQFAELTSRKGVFAKKKGKPLEGVLTIQQPQDWDVFIRAGTLKSRGYQITFRDTLRKMTQSNGGFLLFPRGKGYLIPLSHVRQLVEKVNPEDLKRATVDIFINQDDKGGIFMHYHDKKSSITKFALP